MTNNEKILLGVSVASLAIAVYVAFRKPPEPASTVTTPVDTSTAGQIEHYFDLLWNHTHETPDLVSDY